ncbi:MAG: hypothetical protein IPM53_26685 [Anaerolineaceae bacterium]|nr:hypothetical protein [Anaerolineaceae bacterium]
MKVTLRFFLSVIVVSLLSACGPSEADQLATVEALVVQTVAAMPTQAPQATLPPLPTYTPQATFAAVPSQTPLPTYTPYPTYTPPATATESPMATETVEPAAAATTSGQPVPTSAPVVNVTEQLAAKIQDELTRIDIIRGAFLPLSPGGGGTLTEQPSDCGAIVSSYNSIANVLTVDVSAQSPTVQNAYGVYRAATDTVLSLLAPWVEICRTDLASGVSRRIIDQNQYGILRQALDQPIGQLNQAINSLQSP